MIKIYRASEMKSSPFDKTADHNFLYENGFSFTENPQECHIFLACQMESLVSVAKMFGSQKFSKKNQSAIVIRERFQSDN